MSIPVHRIHSVVLSEENEVLRRFNTHFWAEEMVEWLKALNFPQSDRCCPGIKSTQCSIHLLRYCLKAHIFIHNNINIYNRKKLNEFVKGICHFFWNFHFIDEKGRWLWISPSSCWKNLIFILNCSSFMCPNLGLFTQTWGLSTENN